jgi:hypothetical protein
MFTLQDLGNLGEFVGALGVVVSFIYLAQEMRQSTAAMRAASFNSMVQNSIRLLEDVYRDPEFSEFAYRAERDPESLSAEERYRWDAFMTACFRHFGNLLHQYQVGALEQEMWESYDRTLKDHLRQPSWGEWFLAHQDLFSRVLVESVVQKLTDLEADARLKADARSAVVSETPIELPR